MNLSRLALIGAVITISLNAVLLVLGLTMKGVFILAWPTFAIVLFFGVLIDRLRNKEDDYYEKNIHD